MEKRKKEEEKKERKLAIGSVAGEDGRVRMRSDVASKLQGE